VIEHRFTPDNGAADGTFWNGSSWLGLSGAFGEVRLGREYSPYFFTNIAADPWGYDTVAQNGMVHTAAGVAVSRYGNNISYRTPDMGGLTAHVAVGLAEADDTEHNLGFNVQYKAGPMYVGFGYHRGGATAGLAGLTAGAPALAIGGTSNDNTAQSWGVTGSYDFGVAKLIGAFAMSDVEMNTGIEDLEGRSFSIAATAPLGAGEFRAMVSRLEGTDGVVDDFKTTKFGLGYHYPLSKRTKVYADLGTAKSTDLDRRTAVDFGIQHNF
jgi:predicted porin